MRPDITQNEFYVKNFITVQKTKTLASLHFRHVNYRECDVFGYTLSGSATYTFDDGSIITVKKGDILYASRETGYKLTVTDPDYSIIYVDFIFDGIAPRQNKVFSPKNPEHAENMFRKLLKCYNSTSASSFQECMSLVYDIYGIIRTTANREYTSPGARGKINAAKEYIDTNFKDLSLSVTSLAESIDLSEVYFRKLFKAQFDVSPAQYIISVRLKKAKELMRSPFLSLEECALQSGFSSLQYFCRVFKKATGTTPGSYRNIIRKN
ncbi:MAG: helix-turn-helix domain-containing protein [Oscillospiraceae bacterium]|nr:helix-turn-helix domain-containing protein [Oscillospiraceae bacterium]MBQ6697736.1 helix-turn-helix domain-containing protein [Oscillospiraceae bacterium]